jgi:hypothetical protein
MMSQKLCTKITYKLIQITTSMWIIFMCISGTGTALKQNGFEGFDYSSKNKLVYHTKRLCLGHFR